MPPGSVEPGLLTILEAAGILRLKPSTLRAWILKRRLPFVKLGSRVFFRQGDIFGLIESSIVPARENRNG
jgi:excisionase family DNA binding protein